MRNTLKHRINRRTLILAAVIIIFVIIIIVLLFVIRWPVEDDDDVKPLPSWANPSSEPTKTETPRPSYPNDIFSSPSGTDGGQNTEPTTYPGTGDLIDGEKPPPYEPSDSNLLPIYQDGSVQFET